MDKLENKKLEKIANELLKPLNGLSMDEIMKIIYRLEDLAKEKSKLISL